MNLRIYLGGLMAAFLCLSLACAQESLPGPGGPPGEPLPPPTAEGNAPPTGSRFVPGPPRTFANNSASNNGPATSTGATQDDRSGPPVVGPGISPWLAYGRCDCCGPVGGHGPLFTEAYLRSGVS